MGQIGVGSTEGDKFRVGRVEDEALCSRTNRVRLCGSSDSGALRAGGVFVPIWCVRPGEGTRGPSRCVEERRGEQLLPLNHRWQWRSAQKRLGRRRDECQWVLKSHAAFYRVI